MMQATLGMLATVLVLGASATTTAQEATAQKTPVVQAFEHYEAVRVALSTDKFADVAPHAKALATQVTAVGGEVAKTAATQLAAAKTIEDARTHFGELSSVLVPIFQKEKIPGTFGYMCAMKKKPWVQKGETVQNPYYGAAMATCGSPLAAAGK